MLLESIKFILMGAYVTIAVIAVALPLGFIVGLLLAWYAFTEARLYHG